MELPVPNVDFQSEKIAVTALYCSTLGYDGSLAGALCGLYLGPTLSREFSETSSTICHCSMPQFSRPIIGLSNSALQVRAAPDQACSI